MAIKKQPAAHNPTENAQAIKGLEANAETLRVSITQREKRKIGPYDDRVGLERVLQNERQSLIAIEEELEIRKAPEPTETE